MAEAYGQLENGNQFRLKLDSLIDSRMLIQANSGGGKSYAVRKLLEMTHGSVQQIVIDPEGEFATLREKFDYVYAAAKDGDALAHPKTAKLLAERLLETGVSAIVDIYELKPHERTAFVRIFLDAMVNAPKHLWHPCLVVLDEAHVFAPETDKSEAHGAVADIATRGRKRGFCLVAATQRISKLSKDVAAELNNKLIGRATLDVDVKRAAAELGIQVNDAMKLLRSLDPGQFYGFGPATNVVAPTLMKVGEVVTRHPKRGERATAAPKPTQAILDVLPKLSDLPKEAEQELRTTEDLKREVTKLRRELTTASKTAPAKPDTATVKRLRSAIEELMKIVVTVNTADFKSAANPTDIQQAVEAATRQAMKTLDGKLATRERELERMRLDCQRIADRVKRLLADDEVTVDVAVKPQAAFAIEPRRTIHVSSGQTGDITNPQRKILNAMAWLLDKGIEPMPKNTVAAVAGVSPTSGSYANNLSALKTGGYIDYPRPGEINFTDQGLAITEPAMANGAVHEKWLEIVTGPQRKILETLIAAHPEQMGKESVATNIGVSDTSGSFANNLSALRTLGAIDYPQKGFVALTKYVMP